MKTVQMGPISKFKQRATHLALGLGLAATLAFGAVMPAMAAPGDGDMSVLGGSFSSDISGELLMTQVTLNDGKDKVSTGNLVIGVTDYSGTGDGWNIQLSSDGFQLNGGTALAGFATTGASSFTVAGQGTVTPPDNAGITSAKPVPSTPQTFFAAGDNTGMGDFDVTIGFTQPVSASALVGDYTALIVVDVVATP